MFNTSMNKKNQIIENNQNIISNIYAQSGGNNNSKGKDMYTAYVAYNKNRNQYETLRAQLKKNRIIGGNMSDIFLETRNTARDEKENYKGLQKNMIDLQKQQREAMKIGGDDGKAKNKQKELHKDFKKRIKEGNKYMKKLYKLHDKVEKHHGKTAPVIKSNPVKTPQDIRATIRTTLLLDIQRIAKMVNKQY